MQTFIDPRQETAPFVDLMKVLATQDYCSPEILKELARTPSMRARMKKVGFIPSGDERHRYTQFRPTRSREVLERCGVDLPKPKEQRVASPPPVARTVRIGPRGPQGEQTRLNREQLFEHVWSKPVDTLAKDWGLSGPGLKKICRRLEIPVPPPPRILGKAEGREARAATHPAEAI